MGKNPTAVPNHWSLKFDYHAYMANYNNIIVIYCFEPLSLAN